MAPIEKKDPVIDRLAQVNARITAQQAARMRLERASSNSHSPKHHQENEATPLLSKEKPNAHFRRCHSKPEHPTSNIGARAMEEECRRTAQKNGKKLIFLRNFSVSEEDIVICNRVRRGVDPTWLRHQNAHDRRFLRSQSVQDAHLHYRKPQRNAASESTTFAADGFVVQEDQPFALPLSVPPAPVAAVIPLLVIDAKTPKSPSRQHQSPSNSTLTAREKAMHGRYLIRESFANGSYGKVCAGEDVPSHQEVAVKIIPKYILISPEEKQSVMREKVIHTALDHPHIIKLIDAFEDDGAHYFILERASNGSLSSLINYHGLSEEICRPLFHQILLALEYLHDRNIVHHDIKPHNILLHHPQDHQTTIKLCDFGASRALDVGKDHLPFAGVFGTPGYIAPELLLGEKAYGPAIDMFSAGILLFEMVFGYAPFYPPSSCTYQPVEFPTKPVVSTEVRDLISQLLHKDPLSRITAAKALRHPWFANDKRSCESTVRSPRVTSLRSPSHRMRSSSSKSLPSSPLSHARSRTNSHS